MTDLVIRLCAWERVFPCDEGKPEGSLYLEAAARIEELEAKLAIYEDALKHIAKHDTQMWAIKALSDAKGDDDE